MPPEERLELSGSVQADLRVLSGNASRLAAGNASSMAEHRPGALVGVTETFSDPDSTPWDQDLDSLESLPQIALGPVTPRRRRGALRVAAMIPAALGLVFAGYASHDRINQILESRGVAIESHHAQRPGAGKPDFDNVVHMRARLEADRKHDQKAKLAYELYLQYRPDDAEALNNLGWLYLTTDDRAVHDPQRGLELGLRAIELDRKGTYLDTAAEGQFQAGNPEAAVKLEVEAIAAEGRPATAWFQQGSPVPIYRRQLAKFRRAVALKHGERAVAPEGVPYPIGSATGLPDPPPPSLPDM